MPKLEVNDLKMLRETLCVAQHTINQAWIPNMHLHSDRLGELIDQIDILRPLGPDGKHGERHTAECGCEGVVPLLRDEEVVGWVRRQPPSRDIRDEDFINPAWWTYE